MFLALLIIGEFITTTICFWCLIIYYFLFLLLPYSLACSKMVKYLYMQGTSPLWFLDIVQLHWTLDISEGGDQSHFSVFTLTQYSLGWVLWRHLYNFLDDEWMSKGINSWGRRKWTRDHSDDTWLPIVLSLVLSSTLFFRFRWQIF